MTRKANNTENVTFEQTVIRFKESIETMAKAFEEFAGSIMLSDFFKEALEIVSLEEQLEEKRKVFAEKYYYEEDAEKDIVTPLSSEALNTLAGEQKETRFRRFS